LLLLWFLIWTIATLPTDMTLEQNIKLRRAINTCLRFVYEKRWDDHITFIMGVHAGCRLASRGSISLSAVQYSSDWAALASSLFAY